MVRIKIRIRKVVALLTTLFLLVNSSGFADMIVTDGRTQTTVSTNGTVHDVTTATVSGNTGFNSFKTFNVDAGNTVNLQLTGTMANLVNLVTDTKTNIDGVLNSFKNGKIGGNIFFLNPNGIAVGATGIINVGSLTLATPTKEFMDGIIDSDKKVSSILAKAILAGDMPIDATGLISVSGKVNAFHGVGIKGGDVKIASTGQIKTNYALDASDIVNTGANEDTSVKIKDGKIIIEAKKIVDSKGEISADGKNDVHGAYISISAKEAVTLDGGKISTRGESTAGNIKISSLESVELKNNVTISADTDTDGAVSIDSKKVILGTNNITAGAKGGTSAGTTIISNDIVVTNNQDLNTNYYLDARDTLTVNENISITTNGNNIVFVSGDKIDIKNGATLDTRNLMASLAGGIYMDAKNITLADNVSLLANIDANLLMNGNIILKATDLSDGYMYIKNSASINIGKNAVIKGNNVMLAAVANTQRVFDPENDDNAATEIAKTVANKALSFLSEYSLLAAYIGSNVDAVLNIGEGSEISAANALDVTTSAISKAIMSVFGTGVAVVVGESDVNSKIDIAKNVKLSGNDVNVSALSDNTLKASATTISTAAMPQEFGDIALAIGMMKGNTSVNTAEGSSINAVNNATVEAETDKTFRVTSSASAFQGGILAITTTYADSDVKNTVDLNGIISGNNVNINSKINAIQNRTTSSSGTGETVVTRFFTNTLMNGAIDKIKGLFTSVNTSQMTDFKFSLSGAVTYTDNQNTASINLGSKSQITSTNDTNITANITQQDFRQAAMSAVDSSENNRKENAGSAAVSLLFNHNDVSVTAADGASIDAGNDLNIKATYYMPFDITWLDFITYGKDGEYGKLISNLIDKLNGNLGLQNGFFTTWANSTVTTNTTDPSQDSGNMGNIGVTGSANVAFFDTDVKVDLGKININQNRVGNGINIEALADTFALNASGNFGLTFFGMKSGIGIGGSYEQIDYDTDVTAKIGNGAKIRVNDDFSVKAQDEQMDITLSIAGGQAETFGLEGTFNWLKVNNNTTAAVGNAIIDILNDKTEDSKIPSIYAGDDGIFINIAGSVLKSENTGVGIGVVLTDVDRNTQAYLGQIVDSALIPVTSLNTFNSNRGLNIDAINKGAIYAYSLAATVSTKDNKTDKKSSKGEGGDYGIGISGAVGISNVASNSKAYVNNAKYTSKENLKINSQEDTNINTVSPGIAIVAAEKTAAGLAGSVSINNIANSAAAFVSGKSSVTNDGFIDIKSSSDADILSAAASLGVAISTGGKAFALAGSVSINEISNSILSYIKDSEVTSTNDEIKLNSSDTSSILAVSGGIAVGSTVGIGAAVTVNQINNIVSSYSNNSIITALKNIVFTASNTSDIKGIAGSVGVTTGKGLAAAVTVTVNEIANQTTSYITDGKATSTEESISLDSKDDSLMYSIAGGAAVALQGQALGASAGTSLIDNKVETYIDNTAEVVAKKDVNVKAQSSSEVQTASAGVSVATGDVAASGSVGVNKIATTINAKIDDATLQNEGDINVEAVSNNDINFYGGSIAASKSISGGGTVVINTIKDKATAEINNSLIESNNVTVKSDIDDTVKAYSVNGAGAGKGALAVSTTLTSLENESTAQIVNCKDAGKKIEAGSVSVLADNDAKVNVDGGALAVAGDAGIGAVVDVTKFNNKTIAKIKDSTVNTSGDINVKTNSSEIYNAVIVSGGLSVEVGIAGNVAVGLMNSINEAFIDNSMVKTTDGNVTVEAKDTAKIGDGSNADDLLIVGSLGVGLGAAGIAGSVAVTNIANSTKAKITDSTLDVKKKLSVSAVTDYIIATILPAVGAGLYGGLAITTGVSTIDASTEAYIEETSDKNTVINKNLSASLQEVEVKATSNSEIINAASAGAAGMVGIGASVNVNNIDNKTVAAIGSGVEISAGKDINVTANNTKTIKDFVTGLGAGAVGVSGSISISNMGSAIDDNSLNETGDTKNIVNKELERSTNIKKENLGHGDLFSEDDADMTKFKTNVNSVFDTYASKDNSTAAYIGTNAKVNASGNLKVNASDKLILDNIIGSVSLGGAAVGASVGIANLDSSTKAYIGELAEVTAADISVKANSDIDAKMLSYLGTGSIWGSLGAVVGIINSTNNTLAYASPYSKLDALNSSILAEAKAKEISQTVGVNVSVGVAAGASISEINKSGLTSAYLGEEVEIRGKDLMVKASNDSDIYAEAESGTGGIVSGSGTVANSIVKDVINAKIGKNSIINLTGIFNLLTDASAYAHTKILGVDAGYLTVGAALSDAKIELDNTVNTGESSSVSANTVIIASEQKKADTDINAMSAAGALVGGNGVGAESKVSGNVTTTINDNTKLTALKGLSIGSKSNTKQNVLATRYAGGVVAAGGNSAQAEADVDTKTILKKSLTLTSAEDMKVKAISNHTTYAEAVAGSGGVADISVASVKTTNNSNTEVLIGEIGGTNTITSGNMEFTAENTINQDSRMECFSVGALQGSGLTAKNKSTQNVKVDFEGSNNIASNKFNVNAKNNYVKNNCNESIDFSGGGLLTVSVNESNTEINDMTKVVFGDNTNIKVVNDSKGISSFVVNAYNNINAKDFAKLVSGGLVAVPVIKSIIKNETNKAVIEVGKATIKTAGNMIMNAKSDIIMSAISNLSVYGATAVVHGESYAKTNSDNQIIIKNGADLLSLGNTYFYLTKPYSDTRANVDMDSKTQIWNNTGAPFDADSSSKAVLNINNLIDVKNGAKVRSANTVYLEGGTPIYKLSSLYDYVSWLGDVAASNKVASPEKSFYTKVNVDGHVLAGVNNIEQITIDKDKNVSVSNSDTDINWTITSESLAQNMIAEIDRLEKLKQEYSQNPILKAAYQVDIDRIKADLKKIGLVDSNGYVIRSGAGSMLMVDFITFDNLAANKGDIYINSDDLTGAGKLSAQGYAEITIKNDSPLFLRLNDAKISDNAFGIIFYNSTLVNNVSDINKINSNEKNTAFNNGDIITTQTAQTSKIDISSNYASPNGIAGNIELVGDIENIDGLVKVASQGSIYAKGNILGGTIQIDAKEDVVQSYTEGFTHVGGAPEKEWASIIASGTSGFSSDSTPTVTNTSSIIGNNVFISGRYLNINGLVQAGIADWNLNIGSGDLQLASISNVIAAKNDYLLKLAAHDPSANPLYALKNSYGNISAFYNVLTDQIEVSNVNISGGRLELYGQIMNTSTNGSGELRVLDGYGRVSINNNSSYDLVLNSINISNEVEGIIKITDISKKGGDGNYLETVYTRLGDTLRQVDSTTRDSAGNPSKLIFSKNVDTTLYSPFENQRYLWMTGQQKLIKDTYYTESKSFWGIDFLVKDVSDWDRTTELLDAVPLREGSVLINDTSNSAYNYTYNEYILNSELTGSDSGSYSEGWWIFSEKTYWYKKVYETGSKLYRTHSVKASNPIKINFVGYDSGLANISSKGNVYLNGTIKNTTGDISITSTNRAINNMGTGVITAQNINLTAETGVGNTNDVVVDLKGGSVDAVTSSGDVKLFAQNGNLVFDKITTGNGDVSLSANYDIAGAKSSSFIKGNGFYAASKLGSLGSINNIVNTEIKEFSANVAGNINLKQNGKLGINKITAGSDVTLEVTGNIYDANNNDTPDTRTQEQMLDTWNEMDLFSTAGWTEEQLKYAVDANRFDDTVSSSLDTEEANVIAKNVRIKASGAIGRDEGTKIIDMTNYSSLSDADKLLIASAEKDDITFVYDNNGNIQKALVILREDLDIHSDVVTLNAADYIYLGSEQDININQIKSGVDKNITIKGAGGIYNVMTSGSENITGNDLIIEASNGSIGTALKPLILSLNGRLSARASNAIYFNTSKNLALDYLFSQSSVNINSSADLTNANADDYVNIRANGINIKVDNIGGDDNTLGLMLDKNSVLNITATGDININNANSSSEQNNATILKIGTIDVAGTANILSKADIINADGNSKITANALNFTDVFGSIGTFDDKLQIYVNTISAMADDSMNMYLNNSGTILLKKFLSRNGNINLIASNNILANDSITAGNNIDVNGNNIVLNGVMKAADGDIDVKALADINDMLSDDKASMIANNINLKANSIGKFDNYLGVNTSSTRQGYVNAESEGEIYIVSPGNTLNIGKLYSNKGDISVTTDKSLEVLNLGGSIANLKANNITLHATNGQIGQENNQVVVNVNKEGGNVNLLAANGIYLKQLNFTFFSDYISNMIRGKIVLDLPNSNVRIKNVAAAGGLLNIMFRDKENISDIKISDSELKKLTIMPTPVRMNLIESIDNLWHFNSIIINNLNILDSIKDSVQLISLNNIGQMEE